MARKVTVELVDDLDGAPAKETVIFGVDGVRYEIDLTHEHAAQLRSRLQRFITAARVLDGGLRSAHMATQAPKRRPDPALSTRNRTIRFWARHRGLEVPSMGRIPHAVIEAYRREQLGLCL